MKRTPFQIAALVIGLVLWGYGARVDDQLFRWIGIGFLGAAVLLRFLKR